MFTVEYGRFLSRTLPVFKRILIEVDRGVGWGRVKLTGWQASVLVRSRVLRVQAEARRGLTITITHRQLVQTHDTHVMRERARGMYLHGRRAEEGMYMYRVRYLSVFLAKQDTVSP